MLVGRTVKGYHLEKCLGRGSYGEVYKATKDGGEYAVKYIFNGNRIGDKELLIAENLKTKNNPFLAKYHETIREGGGLGLFIVMDLYTDKDLNFFIENAKLTGFSLWHLMKILIQLALGLSELHRSGILHRDLKPANVFVDTQFNLKIGDFGCGKILDTPQSKTDTFEQIGSPAYISPEILQGHQYDGKTDVWSLGVMLYLMAMSEFPFQGTVHMLPNIIVEKPYTHINALRVPDRQIVDIIHSMLIKNPSVRPSADDILRQPIVVQYACSLNLLEFYPTEIEKEAVVFAPHTGCGSNFVFNDRTVRIISLSPSPVNPLDARAILFLDKPIVNHVCRVDVRFTKNYGPFGYGLAAMLSDTPPYTVSANARLFYHSVGSIIVNGTVIKNNAPLFPGMLLSIEIDARVVAGAGAGNSTGTSAAAVGTGGVGTGTDTRTGTGTGTGTGTNTGTGAGADADADATASTGTAVFLLNGTRQRVSFVGLFRPLRIYFYSTYVENVFEIVSFTHLQQPSPPYQGSDGQVIQWKKV